MKTHGKLGIIAATLLIAVSAIGCKYGPVSESAKPVVSISSPPHGAEIHVGQEVIVQTTVLDTVGINRVELWVDGALNTMAQPPSPQAAQSAVLRWTPSTPGAHVLMVKAINLSNMSSDPAAVAVSVVGGNAPVASPTAPVPPPAPPAQPTPCSSDAAFVEHVTVPDGTNWMPGQAFNKIWRVRNTGTCQWTSGYELVFIGGEAMSTQSTFIVPAAAAGATADLLIAMTAPTTPGAHSGQWRLRSAANGLFGATLNVSINVLGSAPPAAPEPPAGPGQPAQPSANVDPAMNLGVKAFQGTANPANANQYAVRVHAHAGKPLEKIEVWVDGIGAFACTNNVSCEYQLGFRDVGFTFTYWATATDKGATTQTDKFTFTVVGGAKNTAGTCMPGYVWREAGPNDKVCVTPAAKSQAQADNAAAASRKMLNYGPDSCKQGFVWREAFPGDHVCVTGDVRAQAAADNAAAASRKMLGYGPDTCKQGYVWREAFSGDHVCVTGDVRSQAAADNAAAQSRWVSGWYGPHSCVQGYVWREAHPGDDVCVTGAVRTQTANDNAAAASRKETAPYGPDTCKVGFVWREARPDDQVCVTAAVRAQTAADNAAAASRKEVGAYGPDTCKLGFVWREAWSGDHVCVTGEVRSQVAADNAAAPSHTFH